jgi:hypothetical protein
MSLDCHFPKIGPPLLKARIFAAKTAESGFEKLAGLRE